MRFMAALYLAVLVACGNGDWKEGMSGNEVGSADVPEIVLRSNWVEVRLHLEKPYLDPPFFELPADTQLHQIGFGLDLSNAGPSDEPYDSNPRVVSVQLELNSPNWITRQVDPNFPNHFNLYESTDEQRYGLEYRPSVQMFADGKYLLVGANRAFPVMIECIDRPANLPTRCQLWQRREHGFTISIFFNGSRVSEWEALLSEVEQFVLPRIDSIQPRGDERQ